jgi:hypothetical protein
MTTTEVVRDDNHDDNMGHHAQRIQDATKS